MSNTTLWWGLFILFVIIWVISLIVLIYYANRKEADGTTKIPIPAWVWIFFIGTTVVTVIFLIVAWWQSSNTKKEEQTVQVV